MEYETSGDDDESHDWYWPSCSSVVPCFLVQRLLSVPQCFASVCPHFYERGVVRADSLLLSVALLVVFSSPVIDLLVVRHNVPC